MDGEQLSKGLDDLPADVLTSIVLRLAGHGLPHLFSFAYCSRKAFAAATSDSNIWLALCEQKFGSATDVRAWLAAGQGERGLASPCASPARLLQQAQPPSTYRCAVIYVADIVAHPLQPYCSALAATPTAWRRHCCIVCYILQTRNVLHPSIASCNVADPQTSPACLAGRCSRCYGAWSGSLACGAWLAAARGAACTLSTGPRTACKVLNSPSPRRRTV